MTSTTQRWFFWSLGAVLGLALLVGGYYGVRHRAWPAYKERRVQDLNDKARAYYEAGDHANAVVFARKSLQSTTVNPEAWAIAAAACKARDQRAAIGYQDNLLHIQPTKENHLEFIRLCLQFNAPPLARDSISAIATEAADDPEYHELAAEVFTKLGETFSARSHLERLTALRTDHDVARLDLAELELNEDPERAKPGIRDTIRSFADHPELGTRALTLLLRENVNLGLTEGTPELVAKLRKRSDLRVAERVLLLEALHLTGHPDADNLLPSIQMEVAGKPDDAVRVLDLLVRTGRAAEARPWFVNLPPETRRDDNVQRAMADALLSLEDFNVLETHLRGAHWPRNEHLRQAYLARVLRAGRRHVEFNEAWRLAIIATGSDLKKTTDLLGLAESWYWTDERYDVIWKLFNLVPQNETVQRALINRAQRLGNTDDLHRIFSRLVQLTPDDPVIRNNFAYTSLLLDTNRDQAVQVAADLAASDPENPFYATTHAFALYKQGRSEEALAIMNRLSPSALSVPQRMLFHSLFLAATGDAAESTELINGVVRRDLLPEERRLAEFTIRTIARLDRERGVRTRLALNRLHPDDPDLKPGWLQLLALETREAATPEMQLADTLYSEGDWPALKDHLGAARWQERDHLRSALLAYTYRQQEQFPRSLGSWRQALSLARRDPTRINDLRSLATHWEWADERIETLNLLFEGDTANRDILAELTRHYRQARRTTDLVRVLGLHVALTSDTTPEATEHAYYSLLTDSHLSRAHVVAQNAYNAAPNDPRRRLVYAFSLWKQERTAEALPLLADIPPQTVVDPVPGALLQALIQSQVGDFEDARDSLAHFNADSALPEETKLASQVAASLAHFTFAKAP